MTMHSQTKKVFERFINPAKHRHPAVLEHQYLKMASELAEARELMVQIARCTNLQDARLIAQTFLEMHPEEK